MKPSGRVPIVDGTGTKGFIGNLLPAHTLCWKQYKNGIDFWQWQKRGRSTRPRQRRLGRARLPAGSDAQKRFPANQFIVNLLQFVTAIILSLVSPPKLSPAQRRALSKNRFDILDGWHHDAWMRTTLTLDPDVAAKARRGAARLGKPFKSVINSALRIGLDQVLKPAAAKPYRAKPLPLGLKPGFSYDNVAELIAQLEGEDYR